MKEELYNEHPEYQAILDGMMDDYGYDECVARLASYGFFPYGSEISDQEAKSEMEWALNYIEIEKEHELQAAEMDKLRANMIASIKDMRKYSKSNINK